MDRDDLDKKMTQALRLAESERYTEAIALYSRILKSDPNCASAWYNRAVAFLDNQEFDKALLDFAHYLRWSSTWGVEAEMCAEAHRASGLAAYQLFQFQRAAFHFKQSIRLDGTNPIAAFDLADAYLFLGRPDAALRYFRRAFDDAEPPREFNFLWDMAVAHCCLGQWRAMARACQGFLAVAGWEHEIAPYAAFYWSIAEPALAEQLLQDCPDRWPRACIELLTGRRQQVERPDDEVQQQEWAVYRALVLERQGRQQQAHQIYRALTQANPRPSIVFEMALARYRLDGHQTQPLPTSSSLSRRLARIWRADQTQLDDLVGELGGCDDLQRLPELCLALELGATVLDFSALVERLLFRSPLQASWSLWVTILSFDARGRERARALLADVADVPPWLARLIRVPHQRTLVVWDPQLGRAARVLVSGVADIFQLHVLLADLLIGKLGWPGSAPDPEVVAVFSGLAFRSHPSAVGQGVWNLYQPWGLQADGSLPTFLDEEDSTRHWVWNEGQFDDIASVEGEPWLLLGPPAASRSFNVARTFAWLEAQVRLLEELDGQLLCGLQMRWN